MVDLALISAAESDMEIDRISNLHTSCLGFSSLIFGLEIGKNPNIGFDQLMEACQPVWKAIEADVNLAEKLVSVLKQHELNTKKIIDCGRFIMV